jgi:hypothetical protein
MIDVECGVKMEHFHTNFLGMKNINYNFRKISEPKGDGVTFWGEKMLIFGAPIIWPGPRN